MNIQGILLDVEGTTSSISFVYDEMFPFVRRELDRFLQQEWGSEAVQDCLPLLATDIEAGSVDEWLGQASEVDKQKLVSKAVIKLMDADVKATGLKQLQGLIWKNGFHSGQLVAHLYDDVAPAIKAWSEAGIDVRIYSSGSIAAQQLFFGHTVAGDLLPMIGGHYDTTTGPKQAWKSYGKIAREFGIPAENILFISDVGEELTAALAAGMKTVLSIRPGNKSVENQDRFLCIESFDQLSLFEPQA